MTKREKTGGRKKGTPNRVTGTVRQWLADLIDHNRESFEADLARLDPPERVKALTALLPFITPKLQAVTPEQLLEAEYRQLRQLLESAPDEALNEIVKRLNRLKYESNRTHTDD